MLKWWKENGPPVYVSVASYMGLTKTRGSSNPSTSTKAGSGDLNELLKLAGPGGMIQ